MSQTLLVFRKCAERLCNKSKYCTCEFLADWRCDGSGFDQRRLANMLQVLDLRDTVVVDKVIVFFSCGEGTIDLVTQVLNAYVLIIT